MAQPEQQPKVHWLVKTSLILAGLFSVYTLFVFNWSYSSGERAGFVQKLSKRGWACKTWEGELAMVTIPGVLSEKFYFTVPDDEVAAKVSNALGKKATLLYEHHVGIPTSCFGDTPYFVTDVRELK
jgi:hypothetical protein